MVQKTLVAERAAVAWIRKKLNYFKKDFWLLAEAIANGATITDPLPKGTIPIIRTRLVKLLEHNLFTEFIEEEELPKIKRISQVGRKSKK